MWIRIVNFQIKSLLEYTPQERKCTENMVKMKMAYKNRYRKLLWNSQGGHNRDIYVALGMNISVYGVQINWIFFFFSECCI